VGSRSGRGVNEEGREDGRGGNRGGEGASETCGQGKKEGDS